MRVESSFTIEAWDSNGRAVGIETAAPLGGAFIVRAITGGDIEGRSEVLFAGAFNEKHGSGTYVAIDAFEGTIAGKTGTLAFWHANTVARGRPAAGGGLLHIVPDSGTAELTGARGTGEIIARGDDHTLVLEIQFDDADEVEIDGEVFAGEVEAGTPKTES